MCAALGSGLGLVFDPPSYLPWAFLFFAFLACFLSYEGLRALGILFFVGIFTFLGAHHHRLHYDKKVKRLYSTPCVYEGSFLDLTSTLYGQQKGTFLTTGMICNNKRRPLSARFFVSLHEGAAALHLAPEDKLRLYACAHPFRRALTEGEFDPYFFGLAHGIHAKIDIFDPYALAVLQKTKKPSLILQGRRELKNRLMKLLLPRQASVILALVLGDTSLFDEDQKKIYRLVGAQHLLAVSGLQISLLAFLFFYGFRILFNLLPFIGRRSYAGPLAALFSIALSWAFVLLCGSPPSCVRACMMASAVLAGFILRHHSSIGHVLGSAGFLTLVYTPLCILDAGFLLSYIAVMSLIAMPPWGNMHFLVRTLLLSVGCSLATLPLTAFLFGEMAPAGLLANAILVPLASLCQIPAIFLGVLGALFSNTFLAQMGAFFAGLLEAITEGLGALMGTIVYIRSPSAIGTIFLMGGILLFLYSWSLTKYQRIIRSLSLLLCLIPLGLHGLQSQVGVKIIVLPVGQGESTLLMFPSGHVVMIDAGGDVLGKSDIGKKMLIPSLERYGVQHIDIFIISHPDPDHVIGFFSVLEHFFVKEIWHSGFDTSEGFMSKMKAIAQEKNIRIRALPEILGIHPLGKSRLEVLWPLQEAKKLPFKTNDKSLIVRIVHGADSALWAGDIEKEAEAELLKTGAYIASTVLKAPHHGSKSSSSIELVNQVKPQHVIFCTKYKNQWGFPHAEVLNRWKNVGSQLWNTGTHGKLEILLTGKGVKIEPYSQNR